MSTTVRMYGDPIIWGWDSSDDPYYISEEEERRCDDGYLYEEQMFAEAVLTGEADSEPDRESLPDMRLSDSCCRGHLR